MLRNDDLPRRGREQVASRESMIGKDRQRRLLRGQPRDQVRRLESASELAAEAVDLKHDPLDGGIAHGAQNLRLQSLVGCSARIRPDIGPLVHERALDRDQGNAIDDRKRLPAAVFQHPADLVTDASGQGTAMLERHMIDAIAGAMQQHATLDDALANAGQRSIELAGVHQERAY